MRLISLSVNAHSWIDREQSLPHCFTETDSQHFHAQVCCRAREFFRLTITKPRNVARLKRGEVAFAFRFAKKTSEPFDDSLVTCVRGFLRLDCFCFRPCLAPRFDGSAWQRFNVGVSEDICHTLRDHFARSVHT